METADVGLDAALVPDATPFDAGGALAGVVRSGALIQLRRPLDTNWRGLIHADQCSLIGTAPRAAV